MSNTGSKGTQRTEFLGLEQLVLPLFELADHPVEPFDYTLRLISRIRDRNWSEIPLRNAVRRSFNLPERTNYLFEIEPAEADCRQ